MISALARSCQFSERIKLFDSDENQLSQEQKKQVASLAGIAVHNLKINSELLIINNLDPLVIEKLLIENAYIPNEESDYITFTDGQKKLFRLVLSDSAQFLVDIASQLPSFTENSIAEILTRQSFIATTGTEILDEVQKIRDSIASGTADYKQFETDYRRQVVRKLDYLQLFGVDVTTSSKRYKLSVAYVSLAIESERNNHSLSNIEKCLETNNRIVVKGLAGSGKTTMLQWIAIKSAGHKLPVELQEWNDSIPFFIRLREYTDKPLPTTKDFIRGISSIYNDVVPNGWIDDKLNNGKAILLIDGVDEIENERRLEIKEWLEEIVSLFPNTKIIITSRPYAVKESWLLDIGFVNVELQEMNLTDVDSFIDHWHDAALEVEKELEEKAQIIQLQNDIKAELRINNSLLGLATNPLLCALICALNRQRSSSLPSDRIELYNACIAMFFRRDIERKVDLKDYEEIGTRPKEIVLADIAYWLIRNGWSEANEEDVLSRINKKIKSIHGISDKISPDGVLKYFVERSGILRKPIENKIDFPHRTFEEFLAAKAIVEEGDYGLLISNIEDDQWREVIILTCGLARKKEVTKIIDDIILKGDNSDENKEYYHLLAGICAEMAYELPIDSRKQVEDRFRMLIPPKTVVQAKEIAKFGELALPHLTYMKNKTRRVSEIKPIMRTLAIIGNEALLELKEYSVDPRVSVKKEMIEGGKYTNDPAFYGKIILSEHKEISMVGLFSLELFTHLRKIKTLNIDVDSNKSKNIEIIGTLNSLEKLSLTYWKKNLLDIAPLRHCTKLNYLNLSNSRIKDINILTNMQNLKTLILDGTRGFNYNEMVFNPKLKVLGINLRPYYTREMVNLDYLKNAPKGLTIHYKSNHMSGRRQNQSKEPKIITQAKRNNPHLKFKKVNYF